MLPSLMQPPLAGDYDDEVHDCQPDDPHAVRALLRWALAVAALLATGLAYRCAA